MAFASVLISRKHIAYSENEAGTYPLSSRFKAVAHRVSKEFRRIFKRRRPFKSGVHFPEICGVDRFDVHGVHSFSLFAARRTAFSIRPSYSFKRAEQ